MKKNFLYLLQQNETITHTKKHDYGKFKIQPQRIVYTRRN